MLLTGLMAAIGCSRYGYVSVSYPVPPVTALPEDVQSLTIVNRSLAPEQGKDEGIVEAILTGEVAGSDRLASDECIRGVYDAIVALDNTTLVIPSRLRLYGTGTREMPDLLAWEEVQRICEKEGADALLVLETFDTNSDLLVSAAREQVSAILSTGSPQPVGPGQVNVNVVSNWRLYDPARKEIIDQYQHQSYMSFDARAGILPPTALPEAAYASGSSYIQRYLPTYDRVRRTLYKRTSGSAKRQFKAGYRRAEVANWTGAMEVWVDLTEHRKRKTAGRACLNMAVANEVLGNVDDALGWAQRSYEFHDDKLGRSYSKVLLRMR